MNKKDFETLWTLNYPDTVPIAHLFKHDYSDRWFRIHSLPDSKRYEAKTIGATIKRFIQLEMREY